MLIRMQLIPECNPKIHKKYIHPQHFEQSDDRKTLVKQRPSRGKKLKMTKYYPILTYYHL